MQPDSAFKPYPAPEREVPGLRRRTWLYYTGVALAVLLVIAGLALLGLIILLAIGLSQYGNNK